MTKTIPDDISVLDFTCTTAPQQVNRCTATLDIPVRDGHVHVYAEILLHVEQSNWGGQSRNTISVYSPISGQMLSLRVPRLRTQPFSSYAKDHDLKLETFTSAVGEIAAFLHHWVNTYMFLPSRRDSDSSILLCSE